MGFARTKAGVEMPGFAQITGGIPPALIAWGPSHDAQNLVDIDFRHPGFAAGLTRLLAEERQIVDVRVRSLQPIQDRRSYEI